MGTPERNASAGTDRFSSMSVPERLSVDPDDLARTRKNSDLSNTSDNVSLRKASDLYLLNFCLIRLVVPSAGTCLNVLTI